ncbi:DUF1828 domain-containing protein [Tuanshanicoccus lijuaniae]|uniref:DUF1828 domain-containing protein n=1 Tax=Aerococcaceae bacterium zg-1292 TaxID=2774330 RepID=UPI0019371117|nr:DUF1828 domain-containing protein [Aerococcaceae bacterium zg-1292]QQA37933.1 DUF1828 domain-containing protein [Aerococcaceae bacterium zg-1292]
MSNASNLKEIYFNWLFKEYSYKEIEKNIIRIDTPFLDIGFDNIVMYVEFLSNGKINLTDDGWTLNDLENKGISFSSKNRNNNRILGNILNNLGIRREDNEMCITTDLQKFPVAKQRLLQGIMQVNDMIVLRKENKSHIFFEELESILAKEGVLYTTKPSFAGKDGITVQFDFSIPYTGGDKLVRTIRNGNDLNRAKLLTMDAQLLKRTKFNSKYIAVFDDINFPVHNWSAIKSIFDENETATIISFPVSHAETEKTVLSNKAI